MGKAQPLAKWDCCADQKRRDKFPKLRVIAASFEGQSPGCRTSVETEEPDAYSIALLE
jgi:hypothetical protein